MARNKKRRNTPKTFRFQLSLAGIAGIAVVCFCLFLWMFLLGIWAGQTILIPFSGADRMNVAGRSQRASAHDKAPVQTLSPAGKKKSVAPKTGQMETARGPLPRVSTLRAASCRDVVLFWAGGPTRHENRFFPISASTNSVFRSLDRPV